MTIENKKIMVFGVFDNLHDGHRFFIENALKYGNELYIVVTPTHAVEKLKGKLPFYSIKERTQALSKEFPDARIIEGDTEIGLWSPIKNYSPEIIICGYDQDDLYTELLKIKDVYNFELIQNNENYGGKEHHSRFLNKGV